MNDDGWEQRMSERAMARMAIAEAEQIARDAAEGHEDDEEPGWITVIPGSPEGRRTTGLIRYVLDHENGGMKRLEER
ncbi:hypothetical protein GCM10009530_63610 [Microbispora corallina]|uniref:Uncharacterized protein n=1 Tax=Microbispora corallina TaxID=83302 RepID=A0ABQ4GBM0_9ACTN|nr:hypothetical protein [Microbispora corallina]GIH44409.1 hypothetical protein Mco01_74090 [Microbispora corallina]